MTFLPPPPPDEQEGELSFPNPRLTTGAATTRTPVGYQKPPADVPWWIRQNNPQLAGTLGRLNQEGQIDDTEMNWLAGNQPPNSQQPYGRTIDRSRSNRRSGGGGIRFDRALLEENIRAEWRFLMLEEPSNLGGLVSEYMADSRRNGISLNMDAWLLQRARKDARYQLLYGRKPAEMGEQEYIGSLRGVAEDYGMTGRRFNEQVTAAASAGQSAQGFAARADDLRYNRVSRLGVFSRKVAQSVAALGPLGRGSL